ncbi:MAG: deoxyribose-phosphate aldolase [Saccharofermentanales bacterium]|jgi:deoxyribose-phosphate aldolase|nr:deoxyribose-phosphate aldolase [Clostridiaceae bacterium]
MDNSEIFKHIDHTALKPILTWAEVETLCHEAIRYSAASVCVPPNYVRRIRETFGDQLTICTVIGFPLGYSTTETKLSETRQALAEGADEVDMVVNLTDVKDGLFFQVTQEIKKLKEATGDKILKVIIETCYLTEEEKIALCHAVTEARADYIKTSTGFGTAGAKIEDIELFKKHIGPEVKIKAAGGIRTREDLELFIRAGCSRIGTSSAIKLLTSDQG